MPENKSKNVNITKESRLVMYISIPICLLTSRLSSTTLLIYGSLLNRALLSQKNNWQNDSGEVYVRFSIEEIARPLITIQIYKTYIQTDIHLGEEAVIDGWRERFLYR